MSIGPVINKVDIRTMFFDNYDCISYIDFLQKKAYINTEEQVQLLGLATSPDSENLTVLICILEKYFNEVQVQVDTLVRMYNSPDPENKIVVKEIIKQHVSNI